MSNRSLNILFRAAALLLIISSITGLFFSYRNWSYEGRFWENWYPLLIAESQMNSDIESEIRNLSGADIVSMSSTVLEYSDYKNLETLSLRDFAEGLGPYREDPRIDPYMKGALSYFNQDIYEILYLPSNKSPLEYQRLFSGSPLMEEIQWILPDRDKSVVPLILFAAVLMLLCRRSFRFIITAAAFGAAGFIVYAAGQNSLLLVMAVTALFLRNSVRSYGRFSIHLLIPFLPAGAAYYMGLFQIQHLWLTGLVILSFAGTALWPGTGRSGKRKKLKIRRSDSGKDHSLFEPVSLCDTQPSVKKELKERPSFILLAAAVLSLLLGFLYLPGEKNLPAGIPSVEKSEGIWDYEGLVHSESSGQLPGASEYMKHRAYQESFIYGGSYSLPVPGSVISYGDYHLSEGRVFESNTAAVIFSDSWYSSRLEQMAGSGPGKLLASEESPPVITALTSISVGISLHILLVFAVFICVFVLIHFSGIHHASVNSGIRSSGIFVLRRKQQAA